jgi:hypothetical protein
MVVKNYLLLCVGTLQIGAGIQAVLQGKVPFGVGTILIGCATILFAFI